MYESIKEQAATYERETVAKFAEEIRTKTAGEILGSWFYKEYTTPATFKRIKATDPEQKPAADIVEKMTTKKAKKESKNTAGRIEKLTSAELAKDAPCISVCVEFVKSKTWGYNPNATVTAETVRTFSKASGCGYDKESAAIAGAFNSNSEVMKIIYNYAESGETFPYGVHIFAGVPFFDGGCGVSVFYEIFARCGYEFKQICSTKTTNAYTITRKA